MRSQRNRTRLLLALAPISAATGFTGCGGSGTSSPQPPIATPLQIVALSPRPTMTLAASPTAVVATFDQPLQGGAFLTQELLQVFAGEVRVPGAVSIASSDANSLQFVPEVAMPNGAEITARLDPAVLGSDGRRLEQVFSWSFGSLPSTTTTDIVHGPRSNVPTSSTAPVGFGFRRPLHVGAEEFALFRYAGSSSVATLTAIYDAANRSWREAIGGPRYQGPPAIADGDGGFLANGAGGLCQHYASDGTLSDSYLDFSAGFLLPMQDGTIVNWSFQGTPGTVPASHEWQPASRSWLPNPATSTFASTPAYVGHAPYDSMHAQVVAWIDLPGNQRELRAVARSRSGDVIEDKLLGTYGDGAQASLHLHPTGRAIVAVATPDPGTANTRLAVLEFLLGTGWLPEVALWNQVGSLADPNAIRAFVTPSGRALAGYWDEQRQLLALAERGVDVAGAPSSWSEAPDLPVAASDTWGQLALAMHEDGDALVVLRTADGCRMLARRPDQAWSHPALTLGRGLGLAATPVAIRPHTFLVPVYDDEALESTEVVLR